MDLRIEMDWCQRSRQLWLAARDVNTRFFHQLATRRRRMNRISCLKIGDHVFSKQSSIEQALADHFRLFYRQSPRAWWRWLASGATGLTSTQQQDLITPFLEEEVKVAIRAPGPDNIPIFFDIECWDAVGPVVMATIEDFRAGRCNMSQINRAYIVLIPKVQGAEQIGDFRPISL